MTHGERQATVTAPQCHHTGSQNRGSTHPISLDHLCYSWVSILRLWWPFPEVSLLFSFGNRSPQAQRDREGQWTEDRTSGRALAVSTLGARERHPLGVHRQAECLHLGSGAGGTPVSFVTDSPFLPTDAPPQSTFWPGESPAPLLGMSHHSLLVLQLSLNHCSWKPPRVT